MRSTERDEETVAPMPAAPAEAGPPEAEPGQARRGGWGNEPMRTVLPEANRARIGTHGIHLDGRPRRNPGDFSISLQARFGTDQQLHAPGARRQSMRGFEDSYADIVDFIVRATHRIWEEKDVGYIYDHYKHNAQVTDDYGLAFGRDRVIAGTIELINAVPDIRLLPTELVWAGDDEVGFHTSHRVLLSGTNTGWSRFGPPTRRRLQFWLVANCVMLANENSAEHVLYNTSSLVRQLGLDLRETARRLANELDPEPFRDAGFGEPFRLLGQGKPEHLPPRDPDAPFDVEDFIRRTIHYAWNWRMIGSLADAYSPGLRWYGPTDRVLYGLGDYQSFVLSMLAMFPDLAVTVDDVYWMGNDHEGYRASTRWTMVGTHRGWGTYGRPTGRRVRLWGITQHDIRHGRIAEEWMMFNEFEVLQQILRDEPLLQD